MAAGSLFATMQSLAMTGVFSGIGGGLIGSGLLKFIVDFGGLIGSGLLKSIVDFGGYGGRPEVAPMRTR